MTTQNPLQPKIILAGHCAAVHAAVFIRNNTRLVTGDADGFVIVWDVTIQRPRAVWRAHGSTILGIAEWQTDRLITHGRDNRLIVWKLGVHDEQVMNTVPPLSDSMASSSSLGAAALHRPQPWILHILPVNTMNFCSFTACPAQLNFPSTSTSSSSSSSFPSPSQHTSPQTSTLASTDEVLVAVPSTLDTDGVDIYHLPSELRVAQGVRPPKLPTTSDSNSSCPSSSSSFAAAGGSKSTVNTTDEASTEIMGRGMAMSLAMLWDAYGTLVLATGWENGDVAVMRLAARASLSSSTAKPRLTAPIDWAREADGVGDTTTWQPVYVAKAHAKQPLLSLATSRAGDWLLTSGADAMVTKFPIPPPSFLSPPSCPSSTSTTSSLPSTSRNEQIVKSLLSQELSNSPVIFTQTPSTSISATTLRVSPLCTVNTRHAGQQGLQLRPGDERIFATAGWDGAARVYCSRSLRELAVLRWHPIAGRPVGCYAVTLAHVVEQSDNESGENESAKRKAKATGLGLRPGLLSVNDVTGKNECISGIEAQGRAATSEPMIVVGRQQARPRGSHLKNSTLGRSVKETRQQAAVETHWVAVGSKDGRVRLWDIY